MKRLPLSCIPPPATNSLLKVPLPICYDACVIETVLPSNATQENCTTSEITPNVWLRQTETEGQFVEILLPPFELSDLLDECEQYFPMYAVQVLQVLSKSHPEVIAGPMNLSSEMTNGLKNTQILGTLLTRQQVRGERAKQILPELQQAFGLAMKGRLRLTVDPMPD